jgi:hypothetical protein
MLKRHQVAAAAAHVISGSPRGSDTPDFDRGAMDAECSCGWRSDDDLPLTFHDDSFTIELDEHAPQYILLVPPDHAYIRLEGLGRWATTDERRTIRALLA